MKWNLNKLKKAATSKVSSASSEATALSQGLLATKLSKSLNELLHKMVDGKPTIYDKAMDAAYNNPATRSDLAGSYHRLFDGGHTIKGALEASRNASPDDNIFQEAFETMQGLFRDGTTVRGLPLATWDKDTFNSVAEWLNSTFHIPKTWFYDLNTYDAAEVLGATIGAIALLFNWNRAETETFGKLVGGMGLAGALSANPLLLVITVVALARAFHKARQSGEYKELADGTFRGGLGAGATIAVVAMVGGPAAFALLVGIVTGIVVNKLSKKVSVVDISEYTTKQIPLVVAEAKNEWNSGRFKDLGKLQNSVKSTAGWAKNRLEKFKIP